MPALAGGKEARRRAARRGLRLIAAVATGLLLMLAFPGPDLGPVAFVALIPLLLAVETAPPRQAAALGFVAGLVFFLLHIWWINVFGYLPLAALSLVQAAVLAGFAALVPAPRQLGARRGVPLGHPRPPPARGGAAAAARPGGRRLRPLRHDRGGQPCRRHGAPGHVRRPERPRPAAPARHRLGRPGGGVALPRAWPPPRPPRPPAP